MNPNSDLVNLEFAMTYYKLNKYIYALKYANKVINSDKTELKSQAYVVKAKSNFMQMKRKESIKILENAIIELGENDLLCYNLAEIFYDIKEYEQSYDYLIKTLTYNFYNSDAHCLLTYVFNKLERHSSKVLSAYYYLLLEPKSKKSNNLFYGTYELLISYSMAKTMKDRELGESYLGLFNFRMSYDIGMMVID